MTEIVTVLEHAANLRDFVCCSYGLLRRILLLQRVLNIMNGKKY